LHLSGGILYLLSLRPESDGSDGRPRSWYIDVDESKLDDEIALLRTEIYLRDMEPRFQTLRAFDRFSVRA
jgi:DNA polymerase-3 subunit epsilon